MRSRCVGGAGSLRGKTRVVPSNETVAIRTDHLLLDPLRLSDAAPMVTVLGDLELYRFTGGTPPTSAELERRYAAQIAGSSDEDEVWHNWIVRLPAGNAIGFVQATVTGGTADVAWLIGVASQGRGHGREASAAVCAWLVSTGVDELFAHIHPEHSASQQLATAIGFIPSGGRDDDGEDIWTRHLRHSPPLR